MVRSRQERIAARRAKPWTVRWAAAPLLGAALALSGAAQAWADIKNEATAGGTYDGKAVTSNTSSATVPLAPPVQSLVVTVSSSSFDANVAGGGELGAGDTLTFVIRVENNGNLSVDGVMAKPNSISFNGRPYAAVNLAGDPAGPVRLAPQAVHDFTFVYKLEAGDVYSAAGAENGVTSEWSAQASGPLTETAITTASTSETIAAAPALQIAKSFALSEDAGTAGSADVGDIITYSYVVTNIGNVALSGVHVVDRHEAGEAHEEVFDSSAYAGALGNDPGEWNLKETTPAVFGSNADGSAGDAVFDTLGVGGAVTFTYVHLVTQEEFDAQ